MAEDILNVIDDIQKMTGWSLRVLRDRLASGWVLIDKSGEQPTLESIQGD